jgi:hypothetical protein
MTPARNKIEFDFEGWHCWKNDSTGDWGAILSRKGKQPVVKDGFQSREELIEAINAAIK